MYRVKITPCYASGTCNAPQAKYATTNDVVDNDYRCDIYEWDTVDAAQDWIDKMEEGTYHLAHGEMGRPLYEIIDTDSTPEEPDCIKHDADDSSDWIVIFPDKLPNDVRGQLDELNVEYDHAYDDSHDIYSATVYVDGSKYRITYCVQTTAIQANSDDLSNIDWDKPSYYVQS